jgi:hypothetical protein
MEEWKAGILGITAEIHHLNCKKLIQTNQLYPVKLFSLSTGPVFHRSIIPIVTCPLVPSNGRRGEAN